MPSRAVVLWLGGTSCAHGAGDGTVIVQGSPSLAVHGLAAAMAVIWRDRQKRGRCSLTWEHLGILQWSVLRGAWDRAPHPPAAVASFVSSLPAGCPPLTSQCSGFSFSSWSLSPFPEGAVGPCCPSPCPSARVFSAPPRNKGLRQCLHWWVEL